MTGPVDPPQPTPQAYAALALAHGPAVLYVLAPSEQGFAPVWVSPNAPAHLGFTNEEMMDPAWWADHLDPRDREAALAAGHSVLARGHVRHRYRFCKGDGSVAWILDELRLVQEPGSTQPRIVGFWTIIDEQVGVEQALQQQVQRTQQLLNTTLDGYILADTQGRILDVNPSYCRLVGFTREELLQKSIFEMEAALTPEEIEARIQEMVQEGRAAFETRHFHRDGHPVDLAVSITVLQDPDGPLVAAFVRDITESKRAARIIAESEKRYRTIFSHSPVGIALHAADGAFLACNQAYKELFGYTEEELARIEPTHPDDRAEGAALYARLLAGEIDSYRRRKRYLHKDGHVIWTDLTAARVNDEAGDIQYVLYMVQDITEQVQSQEALERRTRRLEIMGQLDRAILAAQSPEAVADRVMERVQDLLPVRRASVLLFDWENRLKRRLAWTGELVSPGDGPSPLGEYPGLPRIQSGRIQVVEHLADLVDPHPAYEILRGRGVGAVLHAPLHVEGELFGALNLAFDVETIDAEHVEIAEDLAALLSLSLQQAQLRAQLQSHAAQLEQRVAERTQALERQSLRQRALADIELAINRTQELQGILDRLTKACTDYLPAPGGSSIILWDRDQDAFSLVATTVPGQEPTAVVTRVRRQGGATRWIIDHKEPYVVSDIREDPLGANPILTEFGNQAYAGAPLLADSEVLGVFFAMHREPHVYTQNEVAFLQALANRGAAAIQKVRLFQELQRSRDQLAQRSAELQERVEEVESLNRALTNLLEDLQAANRRVARTIVKLEAANQELESFTYSVSHDLRAPLRAMQGFADALLEDYGALLDETGQEFAWRIVAAARRMDELINDLLQYSRLVRMDVHTTDVSMEEVVQVVLEELQASIAETHARVQVDRPLPQVRGHRRLLQQIIGNLVSNALKFTQPETPPQVRIWAETTKDKVRLWVEDQGIGIEPAHRERIFRIFERLHGIESYPGTGVGLAIVKRAVERLGGRVGVESTPGAGSRFWVELPGVGGDKVTR